MLPDYCVSGLHMKRCATKKCKKVKNAIIVIFSSSCVLSTIEIHVCGKHYCTDKTIEDFKKMHNGNMVQVSFGFGDTAVDEAK